MKPQKTQEFYRFSTFQLDAAQRRLWCGNEPISLTPKQFDLLFYFVEHAGSVAKKDELLDAIWADCFIEESTLARNVSWLRKKLADGADGEMLIETVPKFGYRFTAEVTCCADEENTFIIEEQTVQYFRGEEIITIDDDGAERENAKTQNLRKAENEFPLLPSVSASSRFRIVPLLILVVVFAFIALAGSNFVDYRNFSAIGAQTNGLNVKTTVIVKNIAVDATRETVDTGLKVQPGDTIKVSAMGILQPETDQTWTFAGDETGKVSVGHTFQKADPWSLVAWIGTETDKADHFQVSKNPSVKTDKSGSLYLAVNDLNSSYADNRGGIIVAVILFRTSGISAETNDLEAAWGTELVKIHKADTLAVRGRGDVAYWEGGELNDLDGSEHDTFGHLAPELNARSLIGKIGSGSPFKIGMNYPPQRMSMDGGLFISINDRIMDKIDAFKNNSGELTIDVEVVRQTETFKSPI